MVVSKESRKYKTVTIVLILVLLLLLGGGGAAVPFLLKKKPTPSDNPGSMCTFAKMTILSGQSRLFKDSTNLLLASAPLEDNQEILPLENFGTLRLHDYDKNQENIGVYSLGVDCTKTIALGIYYNARELRIPFLNPYPGTGNNLHVEIKSIGDEYNLELDPVLEFARVDSDFLYLILQKRFKAPDEQGLACNFLPPNGPPENFGFHVHVSEKNCVPTDNTCINLNFLTEITSDAQNGCERFDNVYDSDPFLSGEIPCNEFYKEENGVFTLCKFGFQRTDLGTEPTAFCVTGEEFNPCVGGSAFGSNSGSGSDPEPEDRPIRYSDTGSGTLPFEPIKEYLDREQHGSGSGSGYGSGNTLENIPATLSIYPCSQQIDGYTFYEGGGVLMPDGIFEDDYMNIVDTGGSLDMGPIDAKRKLAQEALHYKQSMTICSYHALFSHDENELGQIYPPYSTGTDFMVNKFRLHFFHGTDLHDGVGTNDNVLQLARIVKLQLQPEDPEQDILETEYLHTVDGIIHPPLETFETPDNPAGIRNWKYKLEASFVGMGGLTDEKDKGVSTLLNNFNIPHKLGPENRYPNHSYTWNPPLSHEVSDPIFDAGVYCEERCQVLNYSAYGDARHSSHTFDYPILQLTINKKLRGTFVINYGYSNKTGGLPAIYYEGTIDKGRAVLTNIFEMADLTKREIFISDAQY